MINTAYLWLQIWCFFFFSKTLNWQFFICKSCHNKKVAILGKNLNNYWMGKLKKIFLRREYHIIISSTFYWALFE